MASASSGDVFEKTIPMVLNMHGIFEICDSVFKFFVEHMSESKEPEDKWGKFLEDNYSKKWKRICKLNKEQKDLLEKTETMDDFDLSIMFGIIPLLSNGKVPFQNTDQYRLNAESSDCFEHWFDKMAKLRDGLSHEEDTIQSYKKLEEAEKILLHLLETSKKRLFQTNSEYKVDQMLKKVVTDFNDLKNMEIENPKLIQIREKIKDKQCFRKLIFDIRKDSIQSFDSNSILFSGIAFLPLPFITYPDNSSNIPCEDLLNVLNNITLQEPTFRKKFIIIKGVIGSGKTILLRTMYDTWSGKDVESCNFQRLQDFDVVLSIECRAQQSCSSLIQLLNETYKEIFDTEDENIIRRVARSLSLLVLIDGYDEVNKSSKVLVNNVINCTLEFEELTIIVTSRPEAADILVSEISISTNSYYMMSIGLINDLSNKKLYLQKYVCKLASSAEMKMKITNLVETFVGFDENIQEIFRTPILLTIYILIYLNNPDRTNNLLSEFDVFEELVKFVLHKMANCIPAKNEANDKAKTILNLIGEISLCMCQKKKLFITEEEFTDLLINLASTVDLTEVNTKKVLACVLSPTEASSFQGRQYYFYHAILQDLIAAKKIVADFIEFALNGTEDEFKIYKFVNEIFIDIERMNTKLPDTAIVTLDHVSLPETDYSNIIKLVILEFIQINDDELQQSCHPIISRVLRDLAPTFEFCADVLRASGNVARVAYLLAEHIKYSIWKVTKTAHILQASLIFMFLAKVINAKLEVDLSGPLTDRHYSQLDDMFDVLSRFQDVIVSINIEHSHDNYVPLDYIVRKIKDSKFKLNLFKGYVRNEESMIILRDSEASQLLNTKLILSSPTPHHNFYLLEDCKAYDLYLTIQYAEGDFDGCSRLPMQRFGEEPHVYIKGCTQGCEEQLIRLIEKLANNKKIGAKLYLTDCSLEVEGIKTVIKRLQSSGYRTRSTKYSRHEKPQSTKDYKMSVDWERPVFKYERDIVCWRLHITDKKPSDS